LSIAPGAASGDLGTGAVCDEVVGGNATMIICGNFVAPRTLTANGVAVDCVTGSIAQLPARRNGGYCIQATAGQYSYAYFDTF
jgi:hypothetical protein